jgi:hypothetical protein
MAFSLAVRLTQLSDSQGLLGYVIGAGALSLLIDLRCAQPPSLGSTTLLMLVASSLSSHTIETATCSGATGAVMVACMTGPPRPAAYWECIPPSMP